MRRSSLSFLLIVTLLFSCLSLSGCGKVDGEYRAFYDSLVNKDGNFRFRSTNPGDSQDSILQAEGLSGTIDEDVSVMDSTGLFYCYQPVQFPCFSFDLYRDYRTPLHRPSTVDDFRYNSSMTSGSYTAFFEQQEEFAAACGQITAFLKKHFPKGTSFEALEQIPEPEQFISAPQWQAEAKDGSRLLVTFQNKISPQSNNKKHMVSQIPPCGFIRLEVSYRKLTESSAKDYQEFYQALVNPEGNFRFCGTEPGQTYEALAASFEEKRYGRDALAPFSDMFRSKILDIFACFPFFFSENYRMDTSVNLENGEAKTQVQDSLKGGWYTASFYREEDWAEACGQITDFLKTKFPERGPFENLYQLPETEEWNEEWRVEAPDGSQLSVDFQNKERYYHPYLNFIESSRIQITVFY